MSIIVGGFIVFITGGCTKKGGTMGIIAKIIGGLIGSSAGQSLLRLGELTQWEWYLYHIFWES